MLDTQTKYTPEDLLGMKISGISREEMETIVNIRGDDDYATVCISDNTTLTRIKKIIEANRDNVIVDGVCKSGNKITEVRIRLQKNLIRFGVRRTGHEMTEEEKDTLTERLAAARAAKKQEQTD